MLQQRLSTTTWTLQAKSCPEERCPGWVYLAERPEHKPSEEQPRYPPHMGSSSRAKEEPAGGRKGRRHRDCGTHWSPITQVLQESHHLSPKQHCSNPARPCYSSREGKVKPLAPFLLTLGTISAPPPHSALSSMAHSFTTGPPPLELLQLPQAPELQVSWATLSFLNQFFCSMGSCHSCATCLAALGNPAPAAPTGQIQVMSLCLSEDSGDSHTITSS